MAGRALTLRLKSRDGQHVVNQLTLESTIADLKSKITELTKIPQRALRILRGFPPKPVDVTNNSQFLSKLDINTGDTLIVEEDPQARAQAEAQKSEQILHEVQSQYEQCDGILIRKVVPANNSCLFTSVNFVMEGGQKVDLASSKPMRKLIASVVSKDAQTYSRAFLGKSNHDYCKWIVNEETWGGAIELSILSKHYTVEMDVIDTQSGRIDMFGEDQHYSNRVLLLYDGIHYDPLFLEPLDPSLPKKTIFATSDDGILSQAQEIAGEAKASRQYTNVNQFSLRCLVCNKVLNGQTEAQSHAKDSGHINFGEV